MSVALGVNSGTTVLFREFLRRLTAIEQRLDQIVACLDDEDMDTDADGESSGSDTDELPTAAERTARAAGSSDDDMDFEAKYDAALLEAQRRPPALSFASRASLVTSSPSIPKK